MVNDNDADSGRSQEFAAKVLSVLRRHGHAVERLQTMRRLSGGAIQETWFLEAIRNDGIVPLILRLGGSAENSGPGDTVSLADQAAISIAAAAAGAPSPSVVAILCDADGLGSGFIMDHISGETLPRRILREAAYEQLRPRLARRCGEILARIHATPLSSLPQLPRLTAVAMVDRLHSLWSELDVDRPVFELAFQWLHRNMIEEPPATALVHGDFRNGNLIVTSEDVAAVIDWERAFIGDPMYDLAWLQLGSWRFGALDRRVGGFGSPDDLYDGYRQQNGHMTDSGRIRFWKIYGSLDWGVTTVAFARQATTTSRSVERAVIGRRASETEIDLLRLIVGEEANDV